MMMVNKLITSLQYYKYKIEKLNKDIQKGYYIHR